MALIWHIGIALGIVATVAIAVLLRKFAPESVSRPLPEDPILPPTPSPLPEPIIIPDNEKLYEIAKKCLGTEISPNDLAEDDVACVESVEEVYKKFKGKYISGLDKPLLHTKVLEIVLRSHPDFEEVAGPELGAIGVAATGTGNHKIRGHTGICGRTHMMSNNSFNGRWEADYTYEDWDKRYEVLGGMETSYFLPR
jgi:hypothetical protein